MKKSFVHFVVLYFLASPILLYAAINQAEAQPPGTCERSCKYSNFPGNCTPNGVIKARSGDAQCAQSRFNIPTYTAALTTFGNTNGCRDTEAGVDNCASGSCTTYDGKPVLGLAHRTFPIGTRIEVCNLKKPGVCAIATVVDRGPADYIQRATLDAYSTLSAALEMNCQTVPATYKVLSGPGISGEAQPSGPTVAGIEAILDAQRNGAGTGPGMTYTAANTPWGYGYVGTPPPVASGAFNSIGGIPQQNPSTGYQYQQSGTNQYGNYGNGSTNGTGGSGVSVPGASIGNILVQPSTVQRGKTIIVSWTSVNMAPNSCTVLLQGEQFEVGQQGSKSLRTVSSDPSTLTFTLRCTDTNGAVQEKSASATLQ